MVFRSYLLFSSHGPPAFPSFSPLFSSPPSLIPLPFFHLVLFILFQASGLCSFSPHPVLKLLPLPLGFPDSSVGKESACDVGDLGFIPGLGRSPGEGKGYPLQYSVLENSMDYSPWDCKESDTMEQFSLHFT